MIVPAHGRLSDEADVEYYREMVQIVRDRIEDGVERGQTLAQVLGVEVPRWNTKALFAAGLDSGYVRGGRI